MTTRTERRHASEFVVSEANRGRSRASVTVAAGQSLQAGHVLGRIEVDTADIAAAAVAGNTGDGAIALADPAFAAGIVAGVYIVTITEAAPDGGSFEVQDPAGAAVGAGEVGTLFDDVVRFTLSDGAVDFAVGDAFEITVGEGSRHVAEYDPAAADGTQTAVAVLLTPGDAAGGAVRASALVRDAEVARAALEWFDGATAPQKATGEAELAAVGIVAR